MSLKILGIKVSNIPKDVLLARIAEAPKKPETLRISTLNPEILLLAHENEEYYHILKNFDIAVADGFGLKLAALTYFKNLNRITGADLVVDLFRIAEERAYRVGIVVRKNGLSQVADIEEYLANNFPRLIRRIDAIDHEDYRTADLKEMISFAPDFFINTLGAPYQEAIIDSRLDELKTARVAIGVGGALDFLTNKVPRAPKMMRSLGVEWIWRLMIDPKRRIGRIFNAVFVYSLKFIIWRFVLPFFYRPNVACFLYKKAGDSYQVLILERQDAPGHWQIPQGGKDGEPPEVAGRRELNEEVGTDSFRTVTVFRNVHSYIFRYNIIKRYDGRSGGYKGQRQDLYIAEFIGSDQEFKLCPWDHTRWRWEDIGTIVDTVHEDRRQAMLKFVECFKKTI